jgi:hypothetical protein
MSFARSLRYALLGAALSCAFAAPAHALSSITYVSNTGVDTGACATAATACRTIAYAMTKTLEFGEVRALTAGNFYPFSVDKGITVSGVPGATVLQAGAADAITVNAGRRGYVNLIGLAIEGAYTNVAFDGVKVTNAQSITIKNCLIRNFKGSGVAIASAGIAGDKLRYLIEDTTFLKLGAHGVSLINGANEIDGLVNRVTVNGAAGAGVYSENFAYADVTDTVVTNSGVGFKAGVNGWIEIARSTAVANTIAVQIDPNAYGAFSAGNNFFHHNATIQGGTLSVIAPK